MLTVSFITVLATDVTICRLHYIYFIISLFHYWLSPSSFRVGFSESFRSSYFFAFAFIIIDTLLVTFHYFYAYLLTISLNTPAAILLFSFYLMSFFADMLSITPEILRHIILMSAYCLRCYAVYDYAITPRHYAMPCWRRAAYMIRFSFISILRWWYCHCITLHLFLRHYAAAAAPEISLHAAMLICYFITPMPIADAADYTPRQYYTYFMMSCHDDAPTFTPFSFIVWWLRRFTCHTFIVIIFTSAPCHYASSFTPLRRIAITLITPELHYAALIITLSFSLRHAVISITDYWCRFRLLASFRLPTRHYAFQCRHCYFSFIRYAAGYFSAARSADYCHHWLRCHYLLTLRRALILAYAYAITLLLMKLLLMPLRRTLCAIYIIAIAAAITPLPILMPLLLRRCFSPFSRHFRCHCHIMLRFIIYWWPHYIAAVDTTFNMLSLRHIIFTLFRHAALLTLAFIAVCFSDGCHIIVAITTLPRHMPPHAYADIDISLRHWCHTHFHYAYFSSLIRLFADAISYFFVIYLDYWRHFRLFIDAFAYATRATFHMPRFDIFFSFFFFDAIYFERHFHRLSCPVYALFMRKQWWSIIVWYRYLFSLLAGYLHWYITPFMLFIIAAAIRA